MGRSSPVTGHTSRPASRNAFDENVETLGSAEAELAHLRGELKNSDALRSGTNGQSSSSVQNMGPPSSYSYAAVLGASLSRSTTPDPQHVARAPSPCLTPIGGGRGGTLEKKVIASPNSFNGVSSGINESADLVAALSGMNLSTNGVLDNENHLPSQLEQEVESQQNYLFGLQGSQNHIKQHAYLKKSESGHLHMPSVPQSAKVSYSDLGKSNGGGSDLKIPSSDRQAEMQKSALPSSNSYLKGSTNGGGGLAASYQHVEGTNSSFINYGYSVNPSLATMMANQLGTGNLPPLYENVAAASVMAPPGMDSRVLGGGLPSGAAASEVHNLGRMGNQMAGNTIQAPFVDPMYQYLRTSDYAAQLAALNDPSMDRNYLGNSYMNLLELQKAYIGAILSPQKSQYSVPLGSKSGVSNHHGYYGNPAFGVGMSYPGSPMAGSVMPNSPVGPGSPMRLPTGIRNLAGGIMGPWHLDAGCNIDESLASSLLEEFKSNKTKCFELSEIAGHVVEFRYVILVDLLYFVILLPSKVDFCGFTSFMSSADQYGSRFIQQKLETATTEEKNMVYQEIMPQALALMTDVFGNYVVQKVNCTIFCKQFLVVFQYPLV